MSGKAEAVSRNEKNKGNNMSKKLTKGAGKPKWLAGGLEENQNEGSEMEAHPSVIRPLSSRRVEKGTAHMAELS